MIFEPKFEVNIPTIEDASILAIPSPSEGFQNWKGNIIPKIVPPNNENLTILYSLKPDEMFPLKVIYAHTQDQSDSKDNNEEDEFRIANSIKGGIRQQYHYTDYFTDDKFKIIAQSANKTLNEFYTDICKFPMNSSANPFIASDLVVERDTNMIIEYLQSNGIDYLTEFDYYPDYYLYFLLTRFYSYPYSTTQLQYARYRKDANEIQKRFIDNVFEIEAIKYVEILMKPNSIYGIKALMLHFDTSYDPSYWVREYIKNVNYEMKILNPNLYYTTLDLSEILITWTDNEIARNIKIELPNRETYYTRRSWIEAIAGYLIATGIFGFQETPIFNDNILNEDRVWRQYDDYELLLK